MTSMMAVRWTKGKGVMPGFGTNAGSQREPAAYQWAERIGADDHFSLAPPLTNSRSAARQPLLSRIPA